MLAAALAAFIACSGHPDTPEVGPMATIRAVNADFKTTTTDGTHVMWEGGDEIAVFVSGGGTDESQCSAVYRTDISAPESSAVFVLTNGEDPVAQDGCYKAVYPKSQLYKWKSAGKKACSMDLPYQQSVTGPGWDKRASLMAASSRTDEFVFAHCVAYLKFTISADSPGFVSFAATSGTDTELIAARVEVDISDDNTLTVTETTPTSLQRSTATLSMESGEAFPPGTYYLAILPKTYSNGLVFTFTEADGKQTVRKVEGEVVMDKGSVGNLGTVKTGSSGSSIEILKPFDLFNPPARVSLLGDSITSYEGYLPAYFDANGAAYYPTGTVTSVNQQYWYKLIYGKMSNAVLDVNNSWRGSTVIWREHPDYDGKDYCARVERYGLGHPDVILIHGGTNDCTKHSTSYQPRPGLHRADMYPGIIGMDALPTDTQIQEIYDLAEAADTWEKILELEDHYFIHAYVKLLNMIHFQYSEAKVVILIGDWVTQSARDALVKIAGHYGGLYGYRYVDFFGQGDRITKVSSAHPDDAGFTYMANTIYDQVGNYIESDTD